MLSLLASSFALLSVAAGVAPGTAGAGVPEAGWRVSAAAVTGTPPVLPDGLSLGAMAEAQRRARARPLFFSARLEWTEASAASEAWIIDHHQFIGALAVGASVVIGAGRLWVQAGGGASVLREILSRHQRLRIDAAGVPGGAVRSLTVGPYGFADLGISILLRGSVSGFVAGGPTFARTTVDGGAHLRAGGSGRLGMAYDF
jgi:hypothetical protein